MWIVRILAGNSGEEIEYEFRNTASAASVCDEILNPGL